MDRGAFIKTLMLVPALQSFSAFEARQQGMRILKSDRNFTRWKPEMDVAYRVGLDETVLVETTHGMPGLVTRDGIFREAGPDAKINPQTGPVFVDGIRAGDAVAVDILDISTGDWGYCSNRIFEIRDGFVIVSPSIKLPALPMLGCLGVAPSEGSTDTKAPGPTGGNMDCREVRAGSTIVFKARVDGALIGMGDAHALMGDGEIAGQGIETDAMTVVRFRKLPAVLSERPVIIRNDSVSTVGAAEALEDAAWQAADDMVKLLATQTGRSAGESGILVNLLGNLRINQIVDPVKGARMEMPAWIFGF